MNDEVIIAVLHKHRENDIQQFYANSSVKNLMGSWHLGYYLKIQSRKYLNGLIMASRYQK